ncbi:hypothetical protein TBR22_A24140 [Luteitalea sp. TBR-22]|uniref:sulfatase-like hydrolase/transferase n=1 Tax=Luteitalea sp. TBR-22 TaxID=2802971 RepID=UPI001AF14703|nr:sulfatase-like hydrolase/transferase [Luteitalea sp. TBR-22]BCS33187.1 hypothetical protein TBR22_A24140 [Luteitalea sp. TBR-22]
MRRPGAREAVWLTATGAVLASGVDGVLLELQRGFFSGGFLARDVATTWADRACFLVGSLAVDATCAGFGVGLALWLAGRMRWGALARRLLAVGLAAGPLVLASLVQYQILARLGDAFDIGLMFDLVGRKPSELLAVSSAQLLLPVALGIALVAGCGLLLRVLNRRWPGGVLAAPGWQLLVGALACGVLLVAGSTWLRVSSDVQDNGLRRKPAGQVVGTLVTWASDVDRDGHGLLARPADPAPFDARIYPYAIDIPGNGIDEDGIGGDLPVMARAGSTSPPAVTFTRTPPVLVVFLETFRADLLGAREGAREVTPVLNALAAAGASTVQAFSHNGYTVQSRYHLFTGALAGRVPDGTLLDDFARRGYDTAYFSAQDESFGGRAYDIGASRATHFYDARQDKARRYTRFATAGSLGVSTEVVLERVTTYLGTRARTRPLFLYVNFYDTHYPYWHDGLRPLLSDVRVAQGDIVDARADDVRRMYRNTAANVDAAIGRLRDLVRVHAGEEPAIVVLADHGESLFEDGYLGHGYVLNDQQTRIPLIVSGLALAACEPVGQADLRGAILEALAAAPASAVRPAFRACPGHAVFQYLGTIGRPRQIGFARAGGRIVYDIREQQVRRDEGAWTRVDALTGEARAEWLALVQYWERLRVAGVPADGGES